MKFARENKKITTTIALAIFFLVGMVNMLYFVFLPIDSQGNPEHFVETPILEHPSVAEPTVEATEAISSTTLIVLIIGLAMALLIVIILFALLMHAASQRRKRDKQRKADLKTLAQALEAYKQVHGQYPLSSTFQPEYYTGINLSNDWNYYGLPNKEHMSKFIPNWPISDPSIDYMAKNQTNQYIYYPKENGQKFFLYAHLESPGKNEQIDYNKEDNLLRSWGSYNYRLSSGQEQPASANDAHNYTPPTPQPPANPQANPTPTPPPAPATPAPTGEKFVPQPAPTASAEASASPPPTQPQPQPPTIGNSQPNINQSAIQSSDSPAPIVPPSED